MAFRIVERMFEVGALKIPQRLLLGLIALATCGWTAAQAPIIKPHPTNQMVSVGSTATFAASASGAPTIAYQWLKDDVELPGKTNQTLIVTNAQASEVGYYSIRAQNSFGSVTSRSAVLSLIGIGVHPGVTITGSPGGRYRIARSDSGGSENVEEITLSSDGSLTISDYSSTAASGLTYRVEETQASLAISGSLAFGEVKTKQSKTQFVRIQNLTGKPVKINSITYPAAFYGPVESAIAADGILELGVLFQPLVPWIYGGEVVIHSDAPGYAHRVPVSGAGVGSGAILLGGDLDFGPVRVGADPVTRLLTIVNTGDGVLNVFDVDLPEGFTGNWRGALLPAEIKAVEITFKPDSAKPYGPVLEVHSDAISGLNTRGINGTGLAPQIAIEGDLRFDRVVINRSKDKILTVRNTGTASASLSLSAVPDGFSVDWENATLQPEEERPLLVTFRPIKLGPHGGEISFIFDQSVPTMKITASGEGIEAPIEEPEPEPTPLEPVIELIGNLDFGDVSVNQSVKRLLTIRNTGEGRLHVDGIDFPVGFEGAFTGSVAPKSSVTVEVIFRPTRPDFVSGHLQVRSNARLGIDRKALSGNGEATRVLEISIDADFGSHGIGLTPISRKLVLENSGNSPLVVSKVTPPEPFRTGGWEGVVIPPGGRHSSDVLFVPRAIRRYEGEIVVESDATAGSYVKTIRGHGEVATGAPEFWMATLNDSGLYDSSFFFILSHGSVGVWGFNSFQIAGRYQYSSLDGKSILRLRYDHVPGVEDHFELHFLTDEGSGILKGRRTVNSVYDGDIEGAFSGFPFDRLEPEF